MLCPECNISGVCDCHITKTVRFIPRDHKSELKKWLSDLHAETAEDRRKIKEWIEYYNR